MELLVILVVALLVLGPRNLPKVAQSLGRAMGEFRRVSTEFQRTLNTEIAFEEEAEKLERARKTAEAATAEKKEAESAGEGATSPDAGSSPDNSPDSARPQAAEAVAPYGDLNVMTDAMPSAPASAAEAAGPEEKA